MLQLDAARLAEQHADEVRHRARCRRAEVGLVGLALHQARNSGMFLHAVRHGRADAEAEIEGAGQRHGGDVDEGVVGELLVDVRIDHQHRGRRLQDHAAVGRRTLHRLDRDLAARARLVLDHARSWRRCRRQVLGDAAAERVGRAARREAGDDLDGVERLAALRAGAAGRQAKGGKAALAPEARTKRRRLMIMFVPQTVYGVGRGLSPNWQSAARVLAAPPPQLGDAGIGCKCIAAKRDARSWRFA